jgi:hypothetical protein
MHFDVEATRWLLRPLRAEGLAEAESDPSLSTLRVPDLKLLDP